MAFTNVRPHQARLRRSALDRDNANTLEQPRSFNSLGNGTISDKKSTAGSFSNALGARPNAWGSSSIWSGGIPSNLTSTAGTRDHSTSRDSVQQSNTEVEGKTGSGSLVDSSVSEDYSNNQSAWATKRGAPSVRSMSTTQYGDNQLSQQRSTSNSGLPQSFSGNQNLTPFASRPPTVNLNSTSSSSQQPRHSFASTYGNSFANQNSEQPPNIYTKFNRPEPGRRQIPDSAVGSWAEPTTTPSPSDERRQQFPIQFHRSGSFPTSREASLPPSRHADEPPMFSRPDYSRPSQRPTPNSSRAPSISSARNGVFNSYLSADQMAAQLGHMNLNGDGRPSTSYKPNGGANSFSFGSRSPRAFSSGRTDPVEDVEEIDRANAGYLGVDDYPLPHNLNSGNNYSAPSFAERYLQSGNNYEFRPGQPYPGNGVTSRGLPNGGGRTPPDWQGYANSSLSMNRQSPAAVDQQAYLDPQIQQLMATQLRNQYAAAMYNPYALNSLQLNAATQYMGLMPMGFPGMETPPTPRDAPLGDGVHVQSALMYEFKSNTKTKRYELRDIFDHIAEFSGDQHGSRFIQTKLETANSDEKDRVFREIEINANALMLDVFGNYVIQKFFEHGDQTHKKILANKMRGQVLQLSLQMYGCRVVQKALDHVLVDQQAQLIGELEGHVLKCVKDQNGNHVIQKAIERCPAPTIGFIISAFQGQVQHLSIHPYGCRVIQRCLEKCDLPSKSMIMGELMEGIQTMISDQFGNYVVQHIVAHDDGEPKQRVLAIVSHNLESYSKHKFASNVVEKCLERSDDNFRRQVVLTLQASQRRIEGEAVLVAMIRDSFGNYVIREYHIA